jgi:aminoglycoside phosphotransferase (APT) family kinase protein
VLALALDPAPLVRLLAAREQTLIHGDFKLGNLALAPDRVVAVDWGTQTGMAPPAVEWAWYLAIAGNWIEAGRDEILEDCRTAAGAHHDEVAMELALLGALVQLGFNKALDAFRHPDPATRASERADLDWWVAASAHALDRHGLL